MQPPSQYYRKQNCVQEQLWELKTRLKGGNKNKNNETLSRGWLLSYLPCACLWWASRVLEMMTRASQTLPALLLGQDFANTCLRETGLFQVFWHHSHEAALQAGIRVGAFPHLHDPLCWLPGHREGSQQFLTSEPSFTRWLVCPVFLTTPPCTFSGKPWLIKEATAVFQAN